MIANISGTHASPSRAARLEKGVRAACVAGLLVLAGTACVPASGIVDGAPLADPEATASEIARATTPDRPMRVDFEWSLDEPDLRVRGQGVIRMEAPDRLRLDLFGTRGERYLTAALVGEEMRFPGAVPGSLQLPPPALLWAALGIVRPPAGAAVEGVEDAGDGETELRFVEQDGRTVRFRVRADAPPRITAAQLLDGRHTIATLDITPGEAGRPARAMYTDRPASRRLTLTFTGFDEADAFPPDIWRPGAN